MSYLFESAAILPAVVATPAAMTVEQFKAYAASFVYPK